MRPLVAWLGPFLCLCWAAQPEGAAELCLTFCLAVCQGVGEEGVGDGSKGQVYQVGDAEEGAEAIAAGGVWPTSLLPNSPTQGASDRAPAYGPSPAVTLSTV